MERKADEAPRPARGDLQGERMKHVFLAFCGVFVILGLRAIMIQLFPSGATSLQNIADHQYQTTIKLAPYRGTIYDHRGAPLAISIKMPSLAMNPRMFDATPAEIAKLARLLGMPKRKIEQIGDRKKYFAWLKRKIPQQTAEKIKKLNLRGLHFLLEPARFYPGGSSASSLIGYVGIDNTGLFGIERKYESILQGDASKVLRLKDARGQQLFLNADLATPEKPGNSIFLTLDRAIQEIAEEALAQGLAKSRAPRGFVIVSDPHTGRILAIASQPSFNPNNPTSLNGEHTTNMAFNFRFEPGSVMKPFVIAKAIDSGKTSPYEIHNCEKSGRLSVGPGAAIHDDHPKEFRTTEEVLVHSSNICTFKIAERLGREGLHAAFTAFGFAPSSTMLGLPGEVTGYMAPAAKWRPIRFANIAFGQGLMVTGLEVVEAFGVIANGGNLVTPYLIERIESPGGDVLASHSTVNRGRVISSKTAQTMRQILAKVVLEGTASRAATTLYTTAGKTGTAEKIDPLTKGYSDHKRIANFAGFAPVNDPYVVIYVAVDEPQEKPYYGGQWAAPIFSEVAERTLKYLNVASDKETLSAVEPRALEPARSH